MGYYTELIFGASFKKDVPEEVIAIIKALIEGKAEEIVNLPDHPFFECEWWPELLACSSEYFGVNKALGKMWQDSHGGWRVSTRSSVTDYGGQIEDFLDWIKPYLKAGSGEREIYAIVIEEGLSFPRIYTLKEQDEV